MIEDDRKTIFLTIVVVALVISSPVIIKWVLNQDTQLSEESYYNIRMVEQFDENYANNTDVLQQTEYNFNLMHFMFSKTKMNLDAIAKILPVLLGVLSIVLFYWLLKCLNLGQNDIFFAIIILATTSVFLYDFTTFSPEILALPIFLAGLILFTKGNYFSALFFGLTAFINIFYAILAAIIVAGNYLLKRKKALLLAVTSAVVVFSVLAGIFILNIDYTTAFVPLMTGLNGFMIEFGAVKGYASISLGLALIGLFSWWNRDTSKTAIMIIALVLMVGALFFENIRLPVALMLATFAGFSISYLANREWEIFILKGVTLLLIFCILFFSAVLSLNFQIKNITEEEIHAISYLSSANRNDIILSAERNGFIIEEVAGRRAYLDGNSYKFKDYEEKKAIADQIYYARNMKDLEDLLNKEKITHIMIDSEMKSGEVWNGRYEGLLFFLENSDSFIKIFYDDDIQIYRYVR